MDRLMTLRKGEKDKEKKKKVTLGDKYKATLVQSPYGPDVLSDILVGICHFGSTLDPDNPSMIAEYNVGVSIMNQLGIYTNENVEKAVGAMLKINTETTGADAPETTNT